MTKPRDTMREYWESDIQPGDNAPAHMLRFLATRVLEGELKNGCRVLDASDCKAWLEDLADECEGITR